MNNPFEPINARLSNLEALTLELLQLLRSANSSTTSDEVGGIDLACAVTRLSKPRIYTLVSERAIPHAKRGNRLTFRRSELLSWLDKGNRAVIGDSEL
ncbi:helix-turn-helix domain-containing protein [Spirosoma linguale]